MPVDSISLAQNLITGNRTSNKNVNFKGSAPDLEALRQKQDEFRRMSEQTGDKGIIGKIGKFATKAIGVVIAFTATKMCLEKVSNMITGKMSEMADKAVATVAEKAAEKAAGKTAEEAAKLTAGTDKLAKILDKIKKSKIDKYAVNVVAAGAAVGVAMQDFGLVKKNVSSNAENLVDNAVDIATDNGYNSGSSSGDSSGDYNISDSEFDV